MRELPNTLLYPEVNLLYSDKIGTCYFHGHLGIIFHFLFYSQHEYSKNLDADFRYSNHFPVLQCITAPQLRYCLFGLDEFQPIRYHPYQYSLYTLHRSCQDYNDRTMYYTENNFNPHQKLSFYAINISQRSCYLPLGLRPFKTPALNYEVRVFVHS